MKASRVLATVDYKGDHWRRLEEAVAPGTLVRADRRDDDAIRDALRDADAAILHGDLDERFLAAPKLGWIHCDHAGLNKSARPEVFARGLIVTSSAGRSSPALAEHAFFFMLAFACRAPELLKAQREHRWGVPGQDSFRALYGQTVGILGLGNTGIEVAKRARAFGMRVLGYRRSAGPAPDHVDEVFSSAAGDRLATLLARSDFIVLALPLSDRTHHIIGAAELAAMKPNAVLVNMARGAVIDEAALLAALRSGAIAGAGLDTFATEPLPADSPLWDAPNVLITPHTTPQVPDRTGRSLDIIVENIRRYRAGEPLLNRLGPDDVYTRAPARPA